MRCQSGRILAPALLALLVAGDPAVAQEAPQPALKEAPPAEGAAGKNASDARRSAARAEPARRLPSDSTTTHTLELPGRSLRFEATAGSLPLTDGEGRLQAEIAYTSYVLADGDRKTRPVAFVFNGGPGASSAWLSLGALGPWRLPIAGADAVPSAAAATVPNAETWLDFADLVMIDPVGTGYSRFASAQERQGDGAAKSGSEPSRDSLQKKFWSIDGDAESLSRFISRWVNKTGRQTSPKVLVGESYGGFRVPKVARELQGDFGVGVSLLVMMSPVLDYGSLRGQQHSPLNTAALLPSLAATAMEKAGKTPSSALMREAEDYARGEYLTDLLRGPRNTEAVERVVQRVATLTGLPVETVRRYGGRLDSFGFRREMNLPAARVASAYDASVTGYDPNPTKPFSYAGDPFMEALRAPLTSAMLDIYASKLGWHSDARYYLLNGEVSGQWQYGNSPSPPQIVSDLKDAIALDPRLRALVVHGYTDLVTPYFASALILDQLPAYGDGQRIVGINYPGGHMFYSRDASRAAFREDVLIMLAASLNGEAHTR